MNRRPDDNDDLLAATLHSGWAEGPTARFALRAAAAVRRRRLRNTLGATIAVAATACVIGVLALRRDAPTPVSIARSTPTDVPHATAARAGRGYEVISDEELLSVVRDVPVLAVTQPDGHRRIVVLERPAEIEPLE